DLVLTPIKYVNFSVGQGSSWRATTREWSLSSSLNFGVRDLVNDTEEFETKRAEGVPNYFLLRADGSFVGALVGGLAVRVLMSGQYAVDSIISNEQFSIAGARGVRGYLEAEVLGDTGIKTSLELVFPSLRWQRARFATDAFLFYDYGRAG